MEAVYGWVKNIIYYMIFLSVVNNLLADSKYGKYIRFFSGMVLILLVVSHLQEGCTWMSRYRPCLNPFLFRMIRMI